jgi:ribulose-phosphate 3-epimerase
MDIKVVPGILESSKGEVERKIGKVKDIVDEVMIDIIDGKFADNKTIEVEDLTDIYGEMSLGVQLMVEEPVKQLRDCAEVGVDLVMGQIELMKDQVEFIQKARELQILPGLALDLKTPIEDIEEEALVKVSEILLMSVPVGFSGQAFDDQVLSKIEGLRKDVRFKGNIWVDGGVNEKTIERCVEAGASRLSVTSGIWEEKEVEKAYGKLTRLARLTAKG